MSALYIILLIAVVSVSLLLLLLVLMQRPRQEGLGATFGVDVTSQMFGSRTTDVLQKGTVYLTVAFFLLCIGIGLLNARESKHASQLGKELAEQAVPAPVIPPEPPKAETTSPPIEVPPAVPGETKPVENQPAGTPPPPASTTDPSTAPSESPGPGTPSPAPSPAPPPAGTPPAAPPPAAEPTPEPPKSSQ